jgi:hypothetical protein
MLLVIPMVRVLNVADLLNSVIRPAYHAFGLACDRGPNMSRSAQAINPSAVHYVTVTESDA